MSNRFKKIKTGLAMALFLMPGVAFTKVLVIGDPQLNGLDQVTLKRLYLGKESGFQNVRVQLADLPDGTPTRDRFYLQVTNKKPQQIKAYWAKLIFSGRATPPTEFIDDDAVVQWVQASSGRIGYVSSIPAGSTVATLLIIE